eukprot:TRINITY_DN16639_c0_g1_i1.p1 TRINITY_DN16639_c0_g1~~TRINITY_DN16639_c0_g1_i1.p1  ORF type:complete len:675 (+),score=122.11 TRINITY_DN16639_c0_g1_i1:257-2281(+)
MSRLGVGRRSASPSKSPSRSPHFSDATTTLGTPSSSFPSSSKEGDIDALSALYEQKSCLNSVISETVDSLANELRKGLAGVPSGYTERRVSVPYPVLKQVLAQRCEMQRKVEALERRLESLKGGVGGKVVTGGGSGIGGDELNQAHQYHSHHYRQTHHLRGQKARHSKDSVKMVGPDGGRENARDKYGVLKVHNSIGHGIMTGMKKEYKLGTESSQLVRAVGRVQCVSAVRCVVTVDSRMVWVGQQNGTVSVYDVDSRALIRTWIAHPKAVRHLVVAGHFVWSASEDRYFHLWDKNTYAFVREMQGHTAPITCMLRLEPHQVPGGVTAMLTADRDGGVIVWDMHSLDVSHRAFFDFPIHSVCSSGKRLWLGSVNMIHAMMIDTLREVSSWKAHDGRVTGLVSVDNQLWSSGSDRTVRVWSALDAMKEEGTLTGVLLRNSSVNECCIARVKLTARAIEQSSGLLSPVAQLSPLSTGKLHTQSLSPTSPTRRTSPKGATSPGGGAGLISSSSSSSSDGGDDGGRGGTTLMNREDTPHAQLLQAHIHQLSSHSVRPHQDEYERNGTSDIKRVLSGDDVRHHDQPAGSISPMFAGASPEHRLHTRIIKQSQVPRISSSHVWGVSLDGCILVWDYMTHKVLQDSGPVLTDVMECIVCTREGEVWVGCRDGSVSVWVYKT